MDMNKEYKTWGKSPEIESAGVDGAVTCPEVATARQTFAMLLAAGLSPY
jgi:hypothetical protein